MRHHSMLLVETSVLIPDLESRDGDILPAECTKYTQYRTVSP